MKVLEWPSPSTDLNLIEMLWHDLKQSIHARKPSNVAELKQFCKEEWATIPLNDVKDQTAIKSFIVNTWLQLLHNQLLD